MNILNNIEWNKITLYHGTTKKSWEGILNHGFRIPERETNWLGRGMYFGVNNIITPIKHAYQSLQHSKFEEDEPLIIEIKARDIKPYYLNRILDLTTDKGLIYFFLISNEFKELLDELNRDDKVIEGYKRQFVNSSMYVDMIQRFLSLDIEWYIFSKLIEPTIQSLDFRTSLVSDLKNISNIHLSNLIIDWFNYLESAGNEDFIPIKGILANFNIGDPLLLSPYLVNLQDRNERVFHDFISYLNRTELSIFGFEYYRAYGKDRYAWNIADIFVDENVKYCEIERTSAIKNKLMNMMRETGFSGLTDQTIGEYADILLNTTITQKIF